MKVLVGKFDGETVGLAETYLRWGTVVSAAANVWVL